MTGIRPARPDDVDFLVELLSGEDVEPFLAGSRARDREAILGELERMQADPAAFGRFLIEVDGRRAGVMGYERANERSRIAHLGGLAVHRDFRGRGVADEAARLLQRHLFELGYHRLQLECYGFNDRAIRHAERVGFVREGVKRKAYLRHGEWVDGVMFSLLAEDLEQG
ncbi:MAG TPA: GNAT family protein [Gaiellaceae bacterium]|nr:GNAT family protein [Gaiellaceae bacterium]